MSLGRAERMARQARAGVGRERFPADAAGSWRILVSGSSGNGRRSRGGQQRLDRRRRNHQEAAAEPVEAGPILQHDLVPQGKPELIETQAALNELLDALRAAGTFAYDTEFIGERSYFPQLCLIQVATAQRVAVIDAMAGLDLAPLWELLADESVRKLVHSGMQDLEPVARWTGRPAANVLDTQVAAAFVALPYPLSLRRMAEELLGVKLGKSLTFTSWDERPVSDAHLRYAADDVRYLPAIERALAEELERWGHARWAHEECADRCAEAAKGFDPDQAVGRMRGVGGLSGPKRAVLRELLTLRDEVARREDRPTRSVMKDGVLMELARRPIREAGALRKVRDLPRPVIESHGDALVGAIERGLATPADGQPPPVGAEETPRQQQAMDGLWSLGRAWCYARGVDPTIVISRQHFASWWHRRAAGEDVSDHPLSSGWRWELIGRWMDGLRRERAAVRFEWSSDALNAEELAAAAVGEDVAGE